MAASSPYAALASYRSVTSPAQSSPTTPSSPRPCFPLGPTPLRALAARTRPCHHPSFPTGESSPKLPRWMRPFAARGMLSYVRLGLEVLRCEQLLPLLHRLVDWLGGYLWTRTPCWRPWQLRYRLSTGGATHPERWPQSNSSGETACLRRRPRLIAPRFNQLVQVLARCRPRPNHQHELHSLLRPRRFPSLTLYSHPISLPNSPEIALATTQHASSHRPPTERGAPQVVKWGCIGAAILISYARRRFRQWRPSGSLILVPRQGPRSGSSSGQTVTRFLQMRKGTGRRELCGQNLAVSRLRAGVRVHDGRAGVLRREGADERATALPRLPGFPPSRAIRARFEGDALRHLCTVWS